MSIRIGANGLKAVIKGFSFKVLKSGRKTVKIKLAVEQVQLEDFITYFPRGIEPVFSDLPFEKITIPGTEARLTLSVTDHSIHKLKIDKFVFTQGPSEKRPTIQSVIIHLSGFTAGNKEALRSLVDFVCIETDMSLIVVQGELPLD